MIHIDDQLGGLLAGRTKFSRLACKAGVPKVVLSQLGGEDETDQSQGSVWFSGK